MSESDQPIEVEPTADEPIVTGELIESLENLRVFSAGLAERNDDLAELAGNETLKNMLSHVFERIVLKRRTDGLYDPGRGITAHQEHLRLLEAMEHRDANGAVAIVRGHIQAGQKNVMSDLKQRQAIRGLRTMPKRKQV